MKTSQAVSGQHSLAIKKWVVPIYLSIYIYNYIYIHHTNICMYIYIYTCLVSSGILPVCGWSVVNSSFRSCKNQGYEASLKSERRGSNGESEYRSWILWVFRSHPFKVPSTFPSDLWHGRPALLTFGFWGSSGWGWASFVPMGFQWPQISVLQTGDASEPSAHSKAIGRVSVPGMVWLWKDMIGRWM